MTTKDEKIDYAKSYYENNKKKMIAKAAAWSKANRGRISDLRKRPESNHKMHSKKWREANKARADRLSRKSYLRKKYGITIEQYEAMICEHNNVCVICFRSPRGNGSRAKLHIDHCHETGKIRGLICPNCNTALGMVEDNTNILKRMIEYVERHKSQ